MNWTTIWLDSAESELLQHYIQARAMGYAEAYTRAASRIEHQLSIDPSQAGESRSGNKRVIIELPLTVELELHSEQRIAVVTRVCFNSRG